MKPANFLDIGGGASAQVMADGLEVILSDPDVKSVFVNVFGGITACDAVADGIVERPDDRWATAVGPAVGGAAGRQQRRGGPPDPRQAEASPSSSQATTMDEAADRAAQLAAAGA